ncbi:unnamed protein product [Adineta steineri]|uniref:G-protein coupled receptors family 1 profile domain-containing protein n=1 Tax=Adineta steineri TaxID=433720 RepID=A0A814Q4X8_9BILA|nr:unnamed protein product [Adineta steineri]CAF3676400.1 unnamed protein product [Adineta steineri]CAF3961181.1 unnamed protein product [Adineta steineri]
MAVTILPLIQTQITRYGMSTLLILGNIGNIIIIVLFYRRRQNSCAMYLLCAAIVQSAALTFNSVINLYTLDYDDPTVRSLFLCKFRAYITHIWNQSGRYLTVLACIDRYIWTANNTHTRLINRPSTSHYLTAVLFLFWHIFSIHIAVLVTIHNGRCGSFGVYYVIYQVYAANFLGLLPPVLMSIFGFLAYHNMKKLHLRVRPISNLGYDSIIIHRRDRDLLLMVLTEVVIYVVTAIPYPFIVLEVAVTNYIGVSKSTQRVEIENFLNSIALTLFSVTYGSRFYTYFAVSKAFRKDCKTLFIKWKNHVLGRSTMNQIPRARQLQT